MKKEKFLDHSYVLMKIIIILLNINYTENLQMVQIINFSLHNQNIV